MFQAIANQLRGEKEVGVPRRFSVGTIFVLLTIYAIFFRMLVLLGAEPTLTALICLFMGAVTTGQMLLFQGTRPRAASLATGASTAPILLLLLVIDEVTMRWSTWQLTRELIDLPIKLLGGLLFCAVCGAFCGYILGGATAGFFYILHRLGFGSATPVSTKQETVSQPTEHRLSIMARWLNPIQPGRPFHGVAAIFLITFCITISAIPFTWGVLSDVLLTGLAIAVFLSLLSGNFQLWAYWPVVLTAAAALFATRALPALKEMPIFGSVFKSEYAVPTLRLFGGLIGICFSGLVGWIQRCMPRKRETGLGFVALAVSVAALFVLGESFSNFIRYRNQQPLQQLFARIESQDGMVRPGAMGPIAMLSGQPASLFDVWLGQKSGDAEFVPLRPMLNSPWNINLYGPGFTDESVRQFSGITAQQVTVYSDEVTDAGFSQLEEFSVEMLSILSKNVGDPTLEVLGIQPELQKRLKYLHLDRAAVSDEGARHVSKLVVLDYLSLNGAALSTAGLADLAKLPRLQSLTLRNVHLTEEGARALSKSPMLKNVQLQGATVSDEAIDVLARSMPKLQTIDLSKSNLSDKGLKSLGDARRISNIGLLNTNLSEQAIAQFEKDNPACTVRWDKP